MAPNFSEAERQRDPRRHGRHGLEPRRSSSCLERRRPVSCRSPATSLTGPEASPCFALRRLHRSASCPASTWARTCSSSSGTILHELGHVLGNHHEHQRFDRDNYITIDLGNVPATPRRNFDKSTFSAPGPYDFGSIMHYAANAFALDRVAADNDSPAAVSEPGGADGQRDCAVGERPQHDGGTVLLANERECLPGADRGSADAIRSRRHAAGDGAAARLLHEPHGTATAAGSVDRTAVRTSLASRNGSSTFTCRRGPRASARSALSTSSSRRSREPTSGDRRILDARALTPAAFRAAVSLSRDEFLDVLESSRSLLRRA